MRILVILLPCLVWSQISLPNAAPAPSPEVQFLDAVGKPMAGAKVCTYQASSSTPAVTYKDSTAAVLNTNPITLDSAGRASIWLGPNLYKFVLRTGGAAYPSGSACTTGTVLWTQDNLGESGLILAANLALPGGSALVGHIQANSGAVAQTVQSKLREIVSVKDYGAVCNGIADDTASLTVVAALSNITAHILPGTCLVTSSVSFPSTVGLQFDSGAKIQVNSPAVLTIAGSISTGDYQIFSGAGTVHLTGDARVMATWFPGSDIGDKINSAVAAACSGPCQIALPYGQSPSFATTITLPDKYFDLDLSGNMLTYTGSGDALLVPTSNVSYYFISGIVRDGQIVGTSSGASGVHQQSRIGVVYDNLRIGGFTNGSCMWWENTAGAGPGTVQFSEQNVIEKADFENCGKGVRWSVNGGSNSFAYNSMLDVHFGIEDGQTGLSMEGTGATQSLFANGGFYNLRFNLNTASTPGTAIALLNGADWERATIAVNGEQTSGAAASHGLYRDAASVFNNTGSFNVDGTTNTANAGIQILQPQGFHDSLAPVNTYVSDYTGLVRFRQDIRYGTPTYVTHATFATTNSDTSFIVVVPTGASSHDFSFSRSWNSVPNCTVTPNTTVLGAGGTGIGSWYVTPAVDKLTVGLSNTQGHDTTFFAHCAGNPD